VVEEHLSFRKAASALGIQQSAISQRIRGLEDHLGVSLFERHPRGVRITAAGQDFLGRVRVLFDQLDKAVTGARAAGRGDQGDLKIGISGSLTGEFLRALIRRYTAEHPQVRIGWREESLSALLYELRAGRVDVAVVMEPGDIEGFSTTDLWRERLYVALPERHPLSARDKVGWEDLRGETFLMSQAPLGQDLNGYLARQASARGLHPIVQQTAVSQDTLMCLVGLGWGVSLVPAGWLEIKLPDVALRPLSGEADTVLWSAVWSPNNGNPAWRRFLSTARIMSAVARQSHGAPET
jgi:DNA-binding transcriptional LysR family regulator